MKLQEANTYLESRSCPLHEVHPEVSFAAMNDMRPLAHPKSSWAGHILRRRLLLDHGIELPDELGAAGAAGPDDVLDAAAAAWSARRIADGESGRLPEAPALGQQDIAIHY